MTKKQQIETIKARLADCKTNKQKWITLCSFIDDPSYDVQCIKQAEIESGINNIADILDFINKNHA